MKDDDLPIHAWIWVGLYSNGQTISAYTYGMETFGRREMEVLDVEGATAGDVWRFLSAMASYVLECDQTLEDGQDFVLEWNASRLIKPVKAGSLQNLPPLCWVRTMMNGIPIFVLALTVLALLFGGVPWLLDWFEHPSKNLLIMLACFTGLGLWILFKWLRF